MEVVRPEHGVIAAAVRAWIDILRVQQCNVPTRSFSVEQHHYVGLDVSQDLTTICVIEDLGGRIWRGTCASDPGAIAAAVRPCRNLRAKSAVLENP